MQTQKVTPVTCPSCNRRYNATVTNIIDVGQEPHLKNLLLQGQLNVSQCPNCQYSGPLNIPLLYHDVEKELALALTPTELQLPHIEEQKIIGNLTNHLMNSLAPEQRKSYLFTPQTFISTESFLKAILAADGITEEVIQAQQAKMSLVQQLLRIRNEAELRKFVKDHDAELDYQFFEIFTATALNQENQETAQGLLALRQDVAELSSQGKDVLQKLDADIGLNALTPEKLLNDLEKADNDETFLNLVRAGKQLLDYAFFQNLTGQINTAKAEGNQDRAEKLQNLRSRILDASAQVDEEARQIATQISQLIHQLLQAEDPRKIILENLNRLDENFFGLLSANIQEAQQRKQTEVAQRLTQLGQLVVSVIQEQMPPEMRLLQALMQAQSQTPEAIDTILEQQTDLVTVAFIEFLDQTQQEFEQNGQTQAIPFLHLVKARAEKHIQRKSISPFLTSF